MTSTQHPPDLAQVVAGIARAWDGHGLVHDAEALGGFVAIADIAGSDHGQTYHRAVQVVGGDLDLAQAEALLRRGLEIVRGQRARARATLRATAPAPGHPGSA